jgi:hypothetical protein
MSFGHHHVCVLADGPRNPPKPTKSPTRSHVRLSEEQLAALRACANGISLRFEKPEIVNALLAAGYVSRNVAGVISITEHGTEYLRKFGA